MRQIANRRFAGCNAAFATVYDPAQHPQIFTEAWPQKFAVIILAKPVDVKDPGQLVRALRERQPVGPIISEIVATERFHRHRVAPHDSDFANIGSRRLRCDTSTDEYAMLPALRLVYEGCQFFAAAAEDDSGNWHTFRGLGEA